MAPKAYQISIFGKTGCEKCEALKGRIAKIIQSEKKYENFDVAYWNLNTIEGLVQFAKAETVNGQRIPTLQILKLDPETERYEKLKDPRKESYSDGRLFFPVYLQLETDYADAARSVIKPQQIRELMEIGLSL